MVENFFWGRGTADCGMAGAGGSEELRFADSGPRRHRNGMLLGPRLDYAGRRLQGDSIARKRGSSGIDYQRAPTPLLQGPQRPGANRGRDFGNRGTKAPALGARGARGQRTRDCAADNPKSIRNPQSPIRNRIGPLAAAGFDPTRPRGPQKDIGHCNRKDEQ